MAFAIPPGMQDAEFLPSRRGRRGLIAVLILLLILLPLYLWPLRGNVGGLPGSSAVSGPVRDPRSAAAVAQIPGDVWNALMGRTPAPPPLPPAPPPKPPPNLTMITTAEGIPGSSLDQRAGDTLSDGPATLVRGLLAAAGDDQVSTTTELASTPGDGEGTKSAPSGSGSGGYPGLDNLGPWTGGGPGGPGVPGLAPSLDPNVPQDLAPTPEPATLLLAGSNLVLLGAAAWRSRRRRLGIPPTG